MLNIMQPGKILSRNEQTGQLQVQLGDGTLVLASWLANAEPEVGVYVQVQQSATGGYQAFAKNAPVGQQSASQVSLALANSTSVSNATMGQFLGDIDYHAGEVFNRPFEELSLKGLIFVLDSNTLSSSPGIELPEPEFSELLARTDAYVTQLLTAKLRILVVLNETGSPLFRDGLGLAPRVQQALSDAGVTIELVGAQEAYVDDSALYVFPLMLPGDRWSNASLDLLRLLTSRTLVLLFGEWDSWLDYDRYLVQQLDLPVSIIDTTESILDAYAVSTERQPPLVFAEAVQFDLLPTISLPVGTVCTNATAAFDGLADGQTMLTDWLSRPYAAYFSVV